MIGSVTHTPSWALWLAFGLGIFNLALWTFVIWFARRTWRRQLRPALLPYLALLLPAAEPPSTERLPDVDRFENTWSRPE